MARRSLQSQVNELIQFREDFLAGAYPTRSALGPGAVSKTLIKSKSIVASMLDVSELASVATNTGALTVTGDLLAGSGASRMGYSPSSGLYLGNENPALAPFRVTPAGAVTATGATLSGALTATSLAANGTGTIAGWTIDSAKLSRGNVGMGQSGSYRLWSGNLASPALADFSVDNSGNLKAQAGEIGPWDLTSSSLSLDSGAVGLGTSGSNRIWAGSSSPSSAPFRVNSSGALVSTSATVTGAITATSGSFTGSVTTSNLDANGGTMGGLTIDGTLTIGAGGQISFNGSASSITSTRIILSSTGSGSSSAIELRSSGSTIGWLYSNSVDGVFLAGNNGEDIWLSAAAGGGIIIDTTLGAGSGDITIGSGGEVRLSANDGIEFFVTGAGTTYIDTAGRFVASDNIFPNNQTSHYLSDNGTTIGFGGVPTAGTAGAITAYATININGTSYKVALYSLS